jgi:6-pyruvoyltetrahydropterin/6-carboxytetrahydropterin synthase
VRAYFSRRYRLSASHRLHSHAFSEAQNIEVYGKCNNPHGHGHNYVVEVTVGGQVDPVTGMVCNMVALDECVQREIVERFDYTNLNLYKDFAELVANANNGANNSDELVPTTEIFCMAIYELLHRALSQAELIKVRIEETQNNFFEYSGTQKTSK